MAQFPSANIRRAALVPLLRDPDDQVRAAAAETLDRLEAMGSLPEVLGLLKRGSLAEKLRAIYALEKTGDARALPALQYCAARPEEEIRSAAVEVLGRLGFPEALPVLKERLGDSNSAIRAKAIEALGNFADPSIPPLLLPFLDEGDGLLDAEAVLSLARFGKDCIGEERLVAFLRSPHARMREAAARALGILPLT